MSDLEDRARANGISPEVLRNAEEVVARAEDISSLPAAVRQKIVTQQVQQLQSELNEVREVKSQMVEQAAAQNITLLPPLPETKYGGGFTVDYMKQLDIQQNQIAQASLIRPRTKRCESAFRRAPCRNRFRLNLKSF